MYVIVTFYLLFLSQINYIFIICTYNTIFFFFCYRELLLLSIQLNYLLNYLNIGLNTLVHTALTTSTY